MSSLLNDIQSVNLSYLLLVQRLLAEDVDMARVRLGLSQEMADILSGMSVSQLVSLSSCNQLLCELALDDAAQLKGVLQGGRDQDFGAMHTAMLLNARQAGSVTRLGGAGQ
ncbi:flagellar transcriptional regulator FlhD [Cobetia marina]|jgi:flagellar transcriptional activator FlhD|uniref:Flagellar transcriptional regulator FlhD n=1 Tax=Cobetia marina TaxID=28258 RepID=A0ABU9GD71_COBMA|nr:MULTISPECIES: flagellar transcriptional regulator FlhD [Cobetia]MDH2373645.1 flagellar transcriptional regulator FlhD [Cobetia sp. 3AK]MDI6003589.1 flagellar transcriptional regulator FlhD [Cobetia pacifica]MDN2656033.1 flagellar transcriptional regulator FlhD [Cobetia sp. 14N.309.X.WAT.E.A4]MDO6786536.1 flagellar transcriptional regulator FlhD [Cobetia marina]POR06351.1 hypothetical protein BOH68_09500 [Cobetia sp. MM1IDA2H-1]